MSKQIEIVHVPYHGVFHFEKAVPVKDNNKKVCQEVKGFWPDNVTPYEIGDFDARFFTSFYMKKLKDKKLFYKLNEKEEFFGKQFYTLHDSLTDDFTLRQTEFCYARTLSFLTTGDAREGFVHFFEKFNKNSSAFIYDLLFEIQNLDYPILLKTKNGSFFQKSRSPREYIAVFEKNHVYVVYDSLFLQLSNYHNMKTYNLSKIFENTIGELHFGNLDYKTQLDHSNYEIFVNLTNNNKFKPSSLSEFCVSYLDSDPETRGYKEAENFIKNYFGEMSKKRFDHFNQLRGRVDKKKSYGSLKLFINKNLNKILMAEHWHKQGWTLKCKKVAYLKHKLEDQDSFHYILNYGIADLHRMFMLHDKRYQDYQDIISYSVYLSGKANNPYYKKLALELEKSEDPVDKMVVAVVNDKNKLTDEELLKHQDAFKSISDKIVTEVIRENVRKYGYDKRSEKNEKKAVIYPCDYTHFDIPISRRVYSKRVDHIVLKPLDKKAEKEKWKNMYSGTPMGINYFKRPKRKKNQKHAKFENAYKEEDLIKLKENHFKKLKPYHFEDIDISDFEKRCITDWMGILTFKFQETGRRGGYFYYKDHLKSKYFTPMTLICGHNWENIPVIIKNLISICDDYRKENRNIVDQKILKKEEIFLSRFNRIKIKKEEKRLEKNDNFVNKEYWFVSDY